jgi:hypothetical protein
MDSVNMTTETNTGIGGFIGTATPTTNNQGGMTTITANGDPVQNRVRKNYNTTLFYQINCKQWHRPQHGINIFLCDFSR